MDVPSGAPTSRSDEMVPPLTRISVPVALPRARVRRVKCETDAMLGQRLAAKPERPNRRQIVGPRDLARRVTLDREPRVLRIHPFAVVLDAQRLLPAELDGDRNPPRARVERVLDELLDDRRRTLDDLAGGDLIGEVQGQAVDAGHDSVGSRQSRVGSRSRQSQSESVVGSRESSSRQSQSESQSERSRQSQSAVPVGRRSRQSTSTVPASDRWSYPVCD